LVLGVSFSRGEVAEAWS